ncbi:MAG: YihY family inner membrane protein [Clostridia bacterium]
MMTGWRALYGFATSVARRFREERALQTAGSLSYTTLLSLVPLLTVALAIASAFPVFAQAVDALRSFLVHNFLPDARAVRPVMDMLDAFAANAARLTAIGLIGFMVTALMLMLTIDNAMNRIFRVQRRRSMLQRAFVYWGLITLGPMLIGISLSMTSYVVAASLGKFNLDALANTLLGILPFLFTCIALGLLYAIVPFRQVELRHAVIGAILAGIAFELAKRGFALYLSRVPTYRLIYGAFATVPIFLVWLYVSWVVVLAGAVFTAMLPGYRIGRERPQGHQFLEALALFSALVRAHEDGRVEPLRHLARQARLLPYECEQILERAAREGWVTRAEREGWVLARDADSLTVGDVFRVFVYDSAAGGVLKEDFALSLRDFTRRQAA